MFLFLNNINQRGYGFNRGGARANQCALSRKRNILGGGREQKFCRGAKESGRGEKKIQRGVARKR